ncbi:hypothetical protein O181_056912 [Austropuccinia psidii MF-1]|uniref:Uncharacterized protein n=1 Tax=Austropuccinia psidii MF-1 TaxID=1389203 RepID=A0A9Q3HUX2_9BASI|nr:hypothetical protein [Austropuccinia psidii MF-1]
MGPNIPLTTPIASSMNVSGHNIDLENLTAQTSRSWSIPNISVTPIPSNPTHTQMNVSEGPGSTPEISSKAIPNQNFHMTFSCILVNAGNENRVDGGQQKGPLENVTWSGLLEGNTGLTLHQNMEPKVNFVQSQEPIEDRNELYASLPLVHEEKVTGRHHQYASKPRTGHASSSREKIVDDGDENMSTNHSETNDEQRRDNFMAHEEGTQ